MFAPPPAAAPLTDPAQIESTLVVCRRQVLIWTTVGYAAFYFVRKNLSIAMPVMEHQLGISKTRLGLFLTLHGVIYGIAKFLNGILGDRVDGRIMMATGLAACVVLNVMFGLSSTVIWLGIFWMLNGWFQGMGYPPCARLLTHWFSRKELATKMSLWNTAHSLGIITVLVLCGYLVSRWDNWRICFFVPAGLSALVCVGLLSQLYDTPESVGLPEVDPQLSVDSKQRQTAGEFFTMLWELVFTNRFIWLASMANFFVYVLRYAFVDWGPTMLQEVKHVSVLGSSWMVATFELAGLAGMLTTGFLTDRWFRGRGAPLSMLCMLLCGVTMLIFWKLPSQNPWANTSLLFAAGFFIYSPQALVAVIVAHEASKRAAATAVGLTSIFGYASTVLSGWGLGWLAQNYGWTIVFECLTGAAILGALLFAAALGARGHPQDDAIRAS
jgi:sugar phosphate permease